MKQQRPPNAATVLTIATLLLTVATCGSVHGQFADEKPAFDGLQPLSREASNRLFRGRGLALLQHPRLISDLGLNPLQVECVRAIEADMMLELDLATAISMRESERRRRQPRRNAETVPPEFLKAADKTDAMAVELISVILTPTQQTKFDHIRIQWEGPLALRRAEFRQSIGLTQFQYAEIRPFLDELVGQVKGKPLPSEQRINELIGKIMSRIPTQQRMQWDKLAGRIP